MLRVMALSVLVALLFNPCSAAASVIIDQENFRAIGDHYSWATGGGSDIQQSIVAGVTGQLMGIDFWTADPGTSTINPTQVRIGSGSAGSAISASELLYSQNLNFAIPTGMQHIDLSSFNIFLTAGDDFVFEVIGTRTYSPRGATLTSSVDVAYTGYNPLLSSEGTSDLYTDGSAWSKSGADWLHSISGILTADLQFRTYMLVADPPPPTAATPEPSTMLLVGLGAVGTFFMKRRRDKTNV